MYQYIQYTEYSVNIIIYIYKRATPPAADPSMMESSLDTGWWRLTSCNWKRVEQRLVPAFNWGANVMPAAVVSQALAQSVACAWG